MKKIYIFLIVSLSFLWMFPAYSTENQSAELAQKIFPLVPTTVSKPINQITLLAIDLMDNGQVTLRDILYGNDSILTLNMNPMSKGSGSTEIKLQDLAIIPTYQDLAKLDINHDGRIDVEDSIFKKLYLVTLYHDGKRYRITSIADAGIRAIFLHRPIASKKQVQTNDFNASNADQVVLSDSSTRKIQFITVDIKMLKQLATFKPVFPSKK